MVTVVREVPRENLAPLMVATAILRGHRTLLLTVAGLAVVCTGLAVLNADAVLAGMVATLALHVGTGLLGGFIVHESAHAAALRYVCPGVTRVVLRSSFLRFSLVPHGRMTGRQVALVAVVGPAVALAVGATLWWVPAVPGLAWWYLIHGLFLLPPFGDGRALLTGLRASERVLVLGSAATARPATEHPR